MGLVRQILALAADVLLSGLLTGVVVLLGSAGLAVTTAPEWLSLLLEPLSLLFAPGVVLALLFSPEHDYKEAIVLKATFLFYFALVLLLLVLRRHVPILKRRRSVRL